MTGEEIEEKILDALSDTSKEGKKKTIKQLQEELELNRATISKYLTVLNRRGFVRQEAIGPTKLFFLESSEAEEVADREVATLRGYGFSVSKDDLLELLKKGEKKQ